MKALVLGAGGMAGHVIATSLTENGYDVFGLARRTLPYCETITADVRDEKKLEEIINENDFDVIINCIGVLNTAVDKNMYDGIWINGCLPHLLVKLTNGSKTKVIHLSTDCVFSGHGDGGYTETSGDIASSPYGCSKFLGEISDDKNLTFRMSIIGPDINANGIGLFNWFMLQQESVKGFTKAIWTGVTTVTLADAIIAAMEQKLTGLFHLVNNESIDKYSLLKLFNKYRTKPIEITPYDLFSENKSLICTRKDFDFSVPPYASMVDEMFNWITNHKDYYPHYQFIRTITICAACTQAL